MEAKLEKMVESLIALVLVHFATLNHQRVDITCREDLISNHGYLCQLPGRFSCPPEARKSYRADCSACARGWISPRICYGMFQTRNAILITSHVFMQPNLKPPITTTKRALEYKAELEKIDPNVDYLMTLYLSPELTPEEIRKASAAGIVGMSIGLSDRKEGC